MSLIGQTVAVRKYDADGRLKATYAGQVVSQDEEQVVIMATWTNPPMDLRYWRLEPGDLFTETYWLDRYWNAFEIRSRDGQLRGWYCNLTRPPHLADRELSWYDLALDVLITPRGELHLADEDEFDALRLDVSEPETYRHVWEAVAEIERLADSGNVPFAALRSPAPPNMQGASA